MKKYLNKKWRNSLIGNNQLILLLGIFSILFAVDINAQEKIFITNTKGSCIVSNISPEKAKEEAILDAKKNALRIAGVSESISSIDALNTYADNRTINQTFNSFSLIELKGAIVDWSLVKEERTINEANNFVYSVFIDVTVVKYSTNSDKEFAIKIKGFKDAYREGEEINFTLQSTKTCFLKLFLIESADSVTLIYPNHYEPVKKLESVYVYDFPMSSQISYMANLNQSHNSSVALFVATKTNIPFINDLNYNNLLNWLNEIEPYEKCVISKIINFYSK